MDRIISVDDRVKRAEEIYNRRHLNEKVSSASENITKHKTILTKWLAIKIIICICIYIVFCMLRHSNMQFSQNLLNKVNEYILMDTNFIELGQNISKNTQDSLNKFNEYILHISNRNIENNNEENNENIEDVDNNTTDVKEENNEETSKSIEKIDDLIGMGGGESDQIETPTTQMEQDAQTIKSNYSFILPVQGIVSSRFGPREATEIVSANHAGIDIAAAKGSSIISATDGVVTEVSSQGDYRKTYNSKKWRNDNIICTL